MRTLKYQELLELSIEELRGTANCFGFDVDGLEDEQLLDYVDACMSDIRGLAGDE